MNVPHISISEKEALELSQFRDMDYYAVENYALPIELMMENAGLQLAKFVSSLTKDKSDKILIGLGNGNNGGGGLVAARRLAAWGHKVYIETSAPIDKPLPKLQLQRALKFGAKEEQIKHPDIWVDAYLGFSQRLPLYDTLLDILARANSTKCMKISLDIPTGFLGDIESSYFKADKVLTLAAPKKLLYSLPRLNEIYIADLGIPKEVYERFGMDAPPFNTNTILKVQKAK